MENKYYVRNLQTGLLEVKEFAADSQLQLLRITDWVATQLVQGYTNAELIGDKYLTSVRMSKETGRFPAFGKEAFVIPGNIKRAVGEKVQRVQTQSGYIPMALDEYALGVSVENRERNEWAGTPDMLVNGKLNVVSSKIALYREKLQVILLTTYTNYLTGNGLSGASLKWATTGDPIIDMRALILLVLKNTGSRPNKAFFSPTAWELLINNSAVLNRIKYGGNPISPAQVSTQTVAQLLQIAEVNVGYAVSGTSTASLITDGGVKKSVLTTSYLWESVASACAGVTIVGSGSGIEPAYGYTFDRVSSPVVESYYDNATKSQVWDYEHFFGTAVTMSEAGAMYYSLA